MNLLGWLSVALAGVVSFCVTYEAQRRGKGPAEAIAWGIVWGVVASLPLIFLARLASPY